MEREFDQASTDRLLAALYGEPAGADLEAEEQDELAALHGLRSLLAELPDEDPPAAVTAKLLSAAAAPARKAASPIAEPGLWARLSAWLQPVFSHPGLAAAASLVLVAAIGGVLYVNGKKDSAAVPEAASGEVVSADEDLATEAPEVPAALPESEGAASDDLRPVEGARVLEEKAVQLKGTKRASSAPKPTVAKPGPTTIRRQVDAKTADKTELDVAATTEIDLGTVSTSPPPPPSPTPGDGAASGVTRGESQPAKDAPQKVEPAQKKNKTRDLSLDNLRARARTAAKKGDCAQVKKVGSQVRERDGRYYSSVFVRDATIGRCYRAKGK